MILTKYIEKSDFIVIRREFTVNVRVCILNALILGRTAEIKEFATSKASLVTTFSTTLLIHGGCYCHLFVIFVYTHHWCFLEG